MLNGEQLRLLAIVSFVFYNIQAIDYSRNILKDFTRVKLAMLIITIFNTFILFYGSTLSIPMPITYVAGFCLLFLEFKLFSKSSYKQLLFGASVFMLHIMLINITVITILTMVHKSTFFHIIYEDEVMVSLSIAITFLTCTVFLIGFMQLITIEEIIILSNDRYGTNFINIVTCFMILYLIFDSAMFMMNLRFHMQMLFLLSTVAVSGVVFYFCLVHCIKISKHSHFKTKFQRLNEELKEKVEMEKQLRSIAYKDNLTGCFTRKYALDFFETLIRSKEIDFAVTYIDMDGLKAVNDTYGHGEGDRYIGSIAEAIFTKIRTCDVLARIGGDEFLLILPESDEEGARAVMDRVLTLLEENAQAQDLSYKPNISYGIVFVNKGNAQSVKEIMEMADLRMYDHKKLKKTAMDRVTSTKSGGEKN